MVAGYFLGRPSDSGSTDEIMKQVGFNHPEKYEQINGGRGTDQIQMAVGAWQQKLSADFDEVASLLDEANAKAGVAWEGQAAESHGGSLKPMTQFVRDSKDISVAVGSSASNMATAFGDVKHGMPEPPKVDATDSLLEKGGAFLTGSETDLQQQERQATERAQEAKRVYETYDQTIQSEGQNLPTYPEAPQMTYDAGAGQAQQNQQINASSNYQGSTSTQPVGSTAGSGVHGGSGSGGIHGGGADGGIVGGGSSGTGGVPSGTGSAWAESPAGGAVGGGPGAGGGGAAGVGGGAGGAGGVGGGVLAGGGFAGSGAGGGSGAGAGGRGGLGSGAGGRAGGLGGASGSGAGGRGGAGAGAPGMGGAAGRGQGKGEDDEHERPSWLEEQDDVWMNDMPRTAPPVFGEWDADNR
jgi:hypothetical protein